MKVLPKRFDFNGHTKGFIYKLKTLLRVSATYFGSERVIKSCLFFQSSHMNSSTKSHSSLTVHGFPDCFLENTSLPQPNHTLNKQLPRLFVILSRNLLNELLLLYAIIFLSFINIAISLQCTPCIVPLMQSLRCCSFPTSVPRD